jgi:hypothetical protein
MSLIFVSPDQVADVCCWRKAGLVLPSPRPGVSPDNLLKTLRDRCNEVGNLRGGGGPDKTAQDRIRRYLEWATATVRHLAYQISAADIDRLVLSPGYDRLLAASTMIGTDIGTQRVLNGMVSLELDQRIEAFETTITALQGQMARWQGEGVFVAPDTSFYIEHDDKLQDADFRPVLGIQCEPVHVLVPIAVVDELDGLKRSKDAHTRWRAGHTLAVLDRIAAGSPPGPGTLRPQEYEGPGPDGFAGQVTIEIVFDPPGRVRLPISDDEIISRIQALEPVAGRQIILVTYDTGQATRGRAAGLRVRKLGKPVADRQPPTAAG